MNLSIIVLTYNENLHIKRCINSLKKITSHIYIVDSFSSDNTVEIAKELGAQVFQNPFINQAKQFQWGIDNCPIQTEWVMRMDADEYLTDELIINLKKEIDNIPKEITGLFVNRRVYFMNRWIKHGGYYPVKLLRIWRHGKAKIEQRWMDEHIKLLMGKSIEIKGDIIDHNLNNLTWWTQKHNNYATREAIDLLNYKYNLFEKDKLTSDKIDTTNNQDAKTRKHKENYYLKTPLFLRAFLYFLMRYFFQFGFLDGKTGLIWHFLQGFWYRFLVDAKIYQINYLVKTTNRSVKQVIEEDFNYKLD